MNNDYNNQGTPLHPCDKSNDLGGQVKGRAITLAPIARERMDYKLMLRPLKAFLMLPTGHNSESDAITVVRKEQKPSFKHSTELHVH